MVAVGRGVRRGLRAVPGPDAAAPPVAEDAARRRGDRRARRAAPDGPMVHRRGLVPVGHAGLVRRSRQGARRRVHRRGHLLDRLLPLAGRQRSGRGRREDAQHRPHDIAVEDWGLATFTFANGVIATLEAAWTINAPRKTGPSPKHNSVVRLEMVGTRGELMEQWFRSRPGRAGGGPRTGSSSAGRGAIRDSGPVPARSPGGLRGVWPSVAGQHRRSAQVVRHRDGRVQNRRARGAPCICPGSVVTLAGLQISEG